MAKWTGKRCLLQIRTAASRLKTLVAPRDELELQLTKTWEKILGVQPIGVSDNFFELGGHSLLAVRLITQIEKIHGKNLPLATLFQAPTVEQLASILREQGWSAPSSSLEAIEIGGAGSRKYDAHETQNRAYSCEKATLISNNNISRLNSNRAISI